MEERERELEKGLLAAGEEPRQQTIVRDATAEVSHVTRES